MIDIQANLSLEQAELIFHCLMKEVERGQIDECLLELTEIFDKELRRVERFLLVDILCTLNWIFKSFQATVLYYAKEIKYE